MEDHLGFILELLFEALIEIGLSAIVAGMYLPCAISGSQHAAETQRRENIAGENWTRPRLLSVLNSRIPLVHPSKLHGLSLDISPLLAGVAMATVGRGVRRRGRAPVPIESFGRIAFALTVASIRFLMVRACPFSTIAGSSSRMSGGLLFPWTKVRLEIVTPPQKRVREELRVTRKPRCRCASA